jgi:hypothetical protein
LPSISGPAFLQTSHYIINVVTGIIDEPPQFWLPDIVEFALSTFKTWNFITFLAWYFCGYCINNLTIKNFVCRFLIFAYRGHLQALKVRDLKLLCLESIVRFKRLENQSRILKWKIRSVVEWKCSENVNSPFADQYRIFTHIFRM